MSTTVHIPSNATTPHVFDAHARGGGVVLTTHDLRAAIAAAAAEQHYPYGAPFEQVAKVTVRLDTPPYSRVVWLPE